MITFRIFLTLFLLLILVGQLPANEGLRHITVEGKICCLEEGIAGVLVTDGEFSTLTDSSGKYHLLSDSDKTFVYYTLPSGYESPVKNGLPIFYKRINNEKTDLFVRNFEIIKSEKNQEKHVFIVWADPQVIEEAELDLFKDVVSDVKESIAGLDPSNSIHGISCGDMVFDRLNLFDPYIAVMAETGIPFYHVIGNHDMDYSNITNETSSLTYQEKFGPSYYSFNKGKIHYITLNDVFYYGYSYHYMGYLDQKQIDWLKADLKLVPKGTTVIVSLHIPTKYAESKKKPGLLELQKNAMVNAEVLYDLLSDYEVHIMAGHSHEHWNTIISDTIMEHTHSAACAAWWQGEIGIDGTPRGYTVYEVDGNKLTWYFKGVNKSKEEQFTLHPDGSDEEYPDCFIANVYNYDPLWKVLWLENGVVKGEMEQYWGEDPAAKVLYKPGKNSKYSWLATGQTHHLFKAERTQKEDHISVQVVDRFGNVYTQELK